MTLCTWLAAGLLCARSFAQTSECDASSILQSRAEAVLQTIPKLQGGTSCETEDLNAGKCVGNNKCYKCDLTQNVWPTHGKGFPEGYLLCSGSAGTTCSLIDNTEKIIFKNFNDYLVCNGGGTCTDSWNVQNAGAACCVAPSGDSTCAGASISLEPDSACKNDMCCDGEDACKDTTLGGLSSLSCRGENACADSTVSLSRDLLCSSVSKVTSDGPGACARSSFNVADGGDHVVTCQGGDVCDDALFSFAASSKIKFECDSGAAAGACGSTSVALDGSSCLFLDCKEGDDCDGFTVTLATGDNCWYSGPGTAPTGCVETNSTTPCGPVDPEEICCEGAGGCADCCPTTPTTTTKHPHPYSQYGGWRRNRRENRRENRRQNRRQRSYSR